jgi:hypothetical protein
MRLTSPRFTVRQLMVAVAFASVLLGIERGTRYERLLAYHRSRILFVVDCSPEIITPIMLSRSAYHTAMAEKYKRAALHPWVPVAPDPPEPK